MRREEVAALLRASHFFLDLSDYQAFGRTAVEAMASGCVPVVPALGGARETIEDGISGIVVDTFDEASIEKASELALRVDSEVLAHWCMSAVNCAAVMSLRRAALRTVATFTARLPRKRV
ncbi:glycosyltransferase [Microcella sp.]|uniref:glycosyltransferase n=1 Tax=Microcella sp. TaxID=1913979 RepID=UPI0033154669